MSVRNTTPFIRMAVQGFMGLWVAGCTQVAIIGHAVKRPDVKVDSVSFDITDASKLNWKKSGASPGFAEWKLSSYTDELRKQTGSALPSTEHGANEVVLNDNEKSAKVIMTPYYAHVFGGQFKADYLVHVKNGNGESLWSGGIMFCVGDVPREVAVKKILMGLDRQLQADGIIMQKNYVSVGIKTDKSEKRPVFVSTMPWPKVNEFEFVAEVDYTENTESVAADLYPGLADKARQLGADAVVEVKSSTAMKGFHFDATRVVGKAVRMKDMEALRLEQALPGSWQ